MGTVCVLNVSPVGDTTMKLSGVLIMLYGAYVHYSRFDVSPVGDTKMKLSGVSIMLRMMQMCAVLVFDVSPVGDTMTKLSGVSIIL